MKESEKKAKELVEMFLMTIIDNPTEANIKRNWEDAKQCALICVEEILKALYLCDDNYYEQKAIRLTDFYSEVKQEIIKL